MFKCPLCGDYKGKITRTRYIAGRPKRWRLCGNDQCQFRWLTLEEVYDPSTAKTAPTDAPVQDLYG